MEIFNPQPIKEKKAIGRTPKYTPEYYMVMAKQVVEEGMSFREAATKYGCSHGSVSHWSKLYREGKLPKRITKEKNSSAKFEAQMQRQDRYIKELKAQVGELYLENQLLKKAQAYFQQSKSARTSIITSENLGRFQEDAE
jgi:transposase-like protein